MAEFITALKQLAARPALTPIAGSWLQRACACGQHSGTGGECEECKKKREGMLQRAAFNNSTISIIPPIVYEVLRSPGQPLDIGMRAFMEPRFGQDFSTVRVHTDKKAAESAEAVNAHAYTVGRNIVFGTGQYEPPTNRGKHLLAHELTHTLQQGLAHPDNTCTAFISESLEMERNADAAADAVLTGHHARVVGTDSKPTIQRYGTGEHALLGETEGSFRQIVSERAFSYKVKTGESLRKIANKFGLSIEELKAANIGKLRNWPEVSGSGRRVEGFNAGEEIMIPPVLNQATKEALETNELTFIVKGVKLGYGEGIAMGDFFENPEEMLNTPQNKLEELSQLIRDEKSGKSVSTSQWEKATDGRYLKLAEKNEAHFAPPNPKLVATSGKATANHKTEWEKYHTIALSTSQTGDKNKALAYNAFGDHFLTDAFAGGHLINKRDVMEIFKGNLKVDAEGEFTKDSEAFFNEVSKNAFVGDVRAEFSRHETVDFRGVVFRPNIDSVSRFSSLLQGIHRTEPELLSNAIAKAVHDELNERPAGVPVENAKGDKWPLSGDGTLNIQSKEIAKKAVAQSQLNVLDAFNFIGPLNLTEFFKKVWDYVPYPTTAGETMIKKEVKSGTDPKSKKLIDAVVDLIKGNYRIILSELVKRGILKRA